MQPPCAAASSSSGLVLPSAWPIRVGRENPSSLNAPESPVIVPIAARDVPLPGDLRCPLDPGHQYGARVPSG